MSAINFPVLTVTLNGAAPVRVEVGVADFYRYEVFSGQTLMGDKDFSFKQLLPLTWITMKRLKLIDAGMDIDTFVDEIVDLDVDQAETGDGLDPTKSTTNPSPT